MEKTTRIVPFKSWMPDAELDLFFGKANIIEIRRTSKVSEVEVYSDRPVEDLLDLLHQREDIYHLDNKLRTDKQWAKKYRELEKQLSSNEPCQPITRRESGLIEHGFRYLHDNGVWDMVWQG